jgi:RimJ/RimL family protein N-acetyltransferase
VSGPAYRIVTARTTVRGWSPTDAARLSAAIERDLDHLRAWMPWAHREPLTLDARVELLRRFRGQLDLGQDCVYGIFDRDETRVIGGTGLHGQGPEAREIGYWIAADCQGQGLVTEVVAALTRVGFAIERVQRVHIRCDPTNHRSAAVPRRLGYTHEATLRRRLLGIGDGPRRDAMLWSLFAADHPASPAAAAAAAIEAYDAADRRVL